MKSKRHVLFFSLLLLMFASTVFTLDYFYQQYLNTSNHTSENRANLDKIGDDLLFMSDKSICKRLKSKSDIDFCESEIERTNAIKITNEYVNAANKYVNESKETHPLNINKGWNNLILQLQVVALLNPDSTYTQEQIIEVSKTIQDKQALNYIASLFLLSGWLFLTFKLKDIVIVE